MVKSRLVRVNQVRVGQAGLALHAGNEMVWRTLGWVGVEDSGGPKYNLNPPGLVLGCIPSTDCCVLPREQLSEAQNDIHNVGLRNPHPPLPPLDQCHRKYWNLIIL